MSSTTSSVTNLLPPGAAYLIRSGLRKDGSWVNVLRWDPSPTPDVSYIIFRKYKSEPIGHGDGERLAIVATNNYVDQNPIIGLPVYYTICSWKERKVNRRGSILFGGVRSDDVHSLKALRDREEANCVRLLWTPPPNVYSILIRRGFGMSPATQYQGDGIKPLSLTSALDNEAPKNKNIFYTIFCVFRFRDYEDLPTYIISNGIRIQVPPYEIIKNNPIRATFRVLPICNICHLAIPDAPLVQCQKCGGAHHLECWEYNGGTCGVHRCGSVFYERFDMPANS